MKNNNVTTIKTFQATIARLSVTALLATAALSTIGCGTEASDSSDQSSAADEASLDSAGHTCTGLCFYGYDVGCVWYYRVTRPNVTQDCRARVVEACHSRNMSFTEASWQYSPGAEGYV